LKAPRNFGGLFVLAWFVVYQSFFFVCNSVLCTGIGAKLYPQ
jgi:hypothetical protein